MSDATGASAFETLKTIREEGFPHIPAVVLSEIFDIETQAQFDTDRKPTIALLRDLILAQESRS